MAVIGKIIKEDHGIINTRDGEVLADIVYNKDYFQLRTYALNDYDRKNGSKQNIQFTREKAIEFKELLEKFINN